MPAYTFVRCIYIYIFFFGLAKFPQNTPPPVFIFKLFSTEMPLACIFAQEFAPLVTALTPHHMFFLLQIWTNRLLKEFDGIESRLPAGVSLSSHDMDPEAGVCKAVFEAAVSMPSPRNTEDDAEGVSEDGGGADSAER